MTSPSLNPRQLRFYQRVGDVWRPNQDQSVFTRIYTGVRFRNQSTHYGEANFPPGVSDAPNQQTFNDIQMHHSYRIRGGDVIVDTKDGADLEGAQVFVGNPERRPERPAEYVHAWSVRFPAQHTNIAEAYA